MCAPIREAFMTDDESWERLWFAAGNQGDASQPAPIALNEYAESFVQLPFRGVTACSQRSYIAIDSITIERKHRNASISFST
ncbi:MAG: hypothetical protein ABS34_03015 [Opitutaceae bacterium BACL24 MAG-120322-bin51]|nr:MAG: hypothetical protein ABS34_03015 [Opitutaceae bacterium BACL24 MAG-120322-bin51]